MSGAKILIVDDEAAIRRFLRISLEADGYTVIDAESGKSGVAMAATHRPDLVILDLGLPDLEGEQVLTQVRQWSNIPVIILTVRDTEREKVHLLDVGADDYLTKPFSVPELLARVRVALRHTAASEGAPVIRNGEVEIDLIERVVTRRGRPVKLTVLEFNLLALLARHLGKLVTQRQLLREVWGPSAEGNSQYLRVYIGQLRKKLEPDPTRPTLLITEPGVGYRMASLD